MVEAQGARAPQRTKSKRLNYFYLNDLLHKRLHINRGADQITTWCYPLEKRVAYTYSDVKKRMQPAYTTAETAKMLNRGRVAVERAILEGAIEAPQFTYGLNEHKRKFKYMWAERHIMEAHAYFSTVHFGRPRSDGLVTPKNLPTARELRAMIRQEETLYVKGPNDEFIPVWRAGNFD